METKKNWYNAHGLTKIIYKIEPEDNKIFILDFNINDFERIKNGENFFEIISSKKRDLISNCASEKLKEPHENEEFIRGIYKEFNGED